MWAKAIILAGVWVTGAICGLSADISPEIVDAIAVVETGRNNQAVGDRHSAFGAWQIHRPVIADVNQTYGTSYSVDDVRDAAVAQKICSLYLELYGTKLERRIGRPATVSEIARLWNGGPRGTEKKKTKGYGNRVATIYEDIIKRAQDRR